jgi:hypothetical protein
MTLDELQAAGQNWRKKPERKWEPPASAILKTAVESWDVHMAKNWLRGAVELSVKIGVPLEQMAKELINELGN